MQTLLRWLGARSIDRIVAVSPHLDDAAFSIATILADATLPRREVWTMFSATTPDGDAAYSRAMGFADPMQEFEARRDEDRAAMAILGVPFVHVGAAATRFVPEDAPRIAASMCDEQRTLVLLPAGAGVELGPAARVWRRITRVPLGCRAHAEHEWVRDALRTALSGSKPAAADERVAGDNVVIGYYAELPYLWSEGAAALHTRLEALTGQRLRRVAVPANVDLKLAAAKAYRSQFVSEFSDSPAYQRRSLSIDETLFLS